jgi:hypothetical protein
VVVQLSRAQRHLLLLVQRHLLVVVQPSRAQRLLLLVVVQLSRAHRLAVVQRHRLLLLLAVALPKRVAPLAPPSKSHWVLTKPAMARKSHGGLFDV